MRWCREKPSRWRLAESPEISEAMAVRAFSGRKGSESANARVARSENVRRRISNFEFRMKNRELRSISPSFLIRHSKFEIRNSHPVKRGAPMQSTPQRRKANEHPRL